MVAISTHYSSLPSIPRLDAGKIRFSRMTCVLFQTGGFDCWRVFSHKGGDDYRTIHDSRASIPGAQHASFLADRERPGVWIVWCSVSNYLCDNLCSYFLPQKLFEQRCGGYIAFVATVGAAREVM